MAIADKRMNAFVLFGICLPILNSSLGGEDAMRSRKKERIIVLRRRPLLLPKGITLTFDTENDRLDILYKCIIYRYT